MPADADRLGNDFGRPYARTLPAAVNSSRDGGALEQQADAVRPRGRARPAASRRGRGASARAVTTAAAKPAAARPRGMDRDRGAGRARGLAQELRLAPVALDQLRRPARRGSPGPGPGSPRRCRDRPAAGTLRGRCGDELRRNRACGGARGRRASLAPTRLIAALPAAQQLEIAASGARVFHVKHRSGAANALAAQRPARAIAQAARRA